LHGKFEREEETTMLYRKPQILSVAAAQKKIQGSTAKVNHNVTDSNPILPESTAPAYEADE
jgi:hypothetical protein